VGKNDNVKENDNWRASRQINAVAFAAINALGSHAIVLLMS
jgi:hypothetical protein